MKLFYIVIERFPGQPKTREYFSQPFESEGDAWDWARALYKQYGPQMRVVEVRELESKL